MKTKKHKGWEYTIKDLQLGKSFEEIKIPKGWNLWTTKDCEMLWSDEKLRKKFNLEDCWFFIKQPFPKINKGSVAGFDALSVRTYFYCNWSPSDSNPSLGVRFKRRIK